MPLPCISSLNSISDMFRVLLVKHDFAQLSFAESSDEVIGCSGVIRHSDGNVT